jgi:hypothetical protein
MVYAMLDEHCNRTLALNELMYALGVEGGEITYSIVGPTTGREGYNLVIEVIKSNFAIDWPPS